jgi:catechol 2,3-dioxygenase-like lactoylglutathione lyase family enzyme
MHLSLAARDLDASIAFYTTLFGSTPAKRRDDYALFVVDDPGIELALYHDAGAVAAAGTHFGVVVTDVRSVMQKMSDLDAAGYHVAVECETTCCYANQTKVWANDPDGYRWETYVVHEEVDEAGTDDVACCA